MVRLPRARCGVGAYKLRLYIVPATWPLIWTALSLAMLWLMFVDVTSVCSFVVELPDTDLETTTIEAGGASTGVMLLANLDIANATIDALKVCQRNV